MFYNNTFNSDWLVNAWLKGMDTYCTAADGTDTDATLNLIESKFSFEMALTAQKSFK